MQYPSRIVVPTAQADAGQVAVSVVTMAAAAVVVAAAVAMAAMMALVVAAVEVVAAVAAVTAVAAAVEIVVEEARAKSDVPLHEVGPGRTMIAFTCLLKFTWDLEYAYWDNLVILPGTCFKLQTQT